MHNDCMRHELLTSATVAEDKLVVKGMVCSCMAGTDDSRAADITSSLACVPLTAH